MVRGVEVVEREILMSGVDDWVDVPEALYAARQAMGGDAGNVDALPVVIDAVKNLVSQGLVEVGEVDQTFLPWTGSVEEIKNRIDDAHKQATHPIEISDLFWICNTPQGDERGEQLLAQEKETKGNL